MTNRSTILAKIKALLAKTPEAGCTEGEALAAAAKASELLMQYGFSENDLEEREEITCETIFAEGKRLGCLGPIAVFVADFADVRVWGTKENGQSVLKFFGKESDVQVAKYLLHLLHTATRLSWEAYFSDLRAQIGRAHV